MLFSIKIKGWGGGGGGGEKERQHRKQVFYYFSFQAQDMILANRYKQADNQNVLVNIDENAKNEHIIANTCLKEYIVLICMRNPLVRDPPIGQSFIVVSRDSLEARSSRCCHFFHKIKH